MAAPEESAVTVILRSGREQGVIDKTSAAKSIYDDLLAQWMAGSKFICQTYGEGFGWTVAAADVESIEINEVEK